MLISAMSVVRTTMAYLYSIKVDEVQTQLPFVDQHMDSLDLVEIVVEFEKRIGIPVPDEDVEGFKSPEDIALWLSKRIKYRIECIRSCTTNPKKKGGKASMPISSTCIYEIMPNGDESLLWKENGLDEGEAREYLKCCGIDVDGNDKDRVSVTYEPPQP